MWLTKHRLLHVRCALLWTRLTVVSAWTVGWNFKNSDRMRTFTFDPQKWGFNYTRCQ